MVVTSVEEGDVEETSLMVEEEEQIYLVGEETEVQNSGAETTASITVIIIDAEPTVGHGITTSGITTMSPQVIKDTDWMSKRW